MSKIKKILYGFIIFLFVIIAFIFTTIFLSKTVLVEKSPEIMIGLLLEDNEIGVACRTALNISEEKAYEISRDLTDEDRQILITIIDNHYTDLTFIITDCTFNGDYEKIVQKFKSKLSNEELQKLEYLYLKYVADEKLIHANKELITQYLYKNLNKHVSNKFIY